MFWAHKEDAVDVYLSERVPYWRKQGKFFEDWLDRLIIMGVITEVDWYKANGKYFGYPRCCIEFFISLIGEPEAEDLGKCVYADKYYGKDNFVGYVRCPKCRIQRGEIWENINDY